MKSTIKENQITIIETTLHCETCGNEIPLPRSVQKLIERMNYLFASETAKLKDAHQKEIEATREEFQNALNAERDTMKAQAEMQLRHQFDQRHEDLECQKAALSERELSCFRKERELLARETRFDQEVQLRLEQLIAEREQTIREESVATVQELFQAKLREKDEHIGQINRSIAELQRKGLQASQQIQGEAQEQALEDLLASRFPVDTFAATHTGTRGADLLQTVTLSNGQQGGSILYESKRTKQFNENWIGKIKEAQLKIGASFAVIVTSSLPPDAQRISVIRDVLVCDLPSVVGLAIVLRLFLIHYSETTAALQGRSGKIERIYNFLVTRGFEHFRSIIDDSVIMQQEIEKDRRIYERNAKERINRLQKIIESIISLYDEMQGIAFEPNVPEPASQNGGSPDSSTPASKNAKTQEDLDDEMAERYADLMLEAQYYEDYDSR